MEGLCFQEHASLFSVIFISHIPSSPTICLCMGVNIARVPFENGLSAGGGISLNKNEYRRTLIMLRSLKSGVSGYVRLERRTLMGTLQFTVNGISGDGERYAVLLYKNNGGYSGIRLEQFSQPRYGQTGLVWKFDPRNIETRTLEQYDLAAVIEIQNGICDLLLCGNLNGSVEADWIQVRDAACRLFSPVRISGASIAPIDEPDLNKKHQPKTLPDYSEEMPVYPENQQDDQSSSVEATDDCEADISEMDARPEHTDPLAESDVTTEKQQHPNSEEYCCEASENSEDETVLSPSEASPSMQADFRYSDQYEPDDLDVPARDDILLNRVFTDSPSNVGTAIPDGQGAAAEILDVPAQDDFTDEPTAGEMLALNDPSAVWPDMIEPLRSLFFSKQPVFPFDTDDFVFIRVPMIENTECTDCLIGLSCGCGSPEKICYAIPAAYTPEPPAGMEGYVWRGNRNNGYWVICETITV